METFSSFIMLAILFFIIIMSYFTEKKLKKKISILEKQLKDSYELLRKSEMKVADNLEEIRWLKWQIEHPAKYKKGDKAQEWLVVSRELYKPGLIDSIIDAAKSFVFVWIGMTPAQRSRKNVPHYIYEVIHTISGDKDRKSESELSQIIQAEAK